MWGKKQSKKRNAGRMPVYFRWGSVPYNPYKDFGIFQEYWPHDNHTTIIATLIREWRLSVFVPGVKTTLF